MVKVMITRKVVNIVAMQVCANVSASDAEILDVCNMENPSGTEKGWQIVCRGQCDVPDILPVQCGDFADRKHFIVLC